MDSRLKSYATVTRDEALAAARATHFSWVLSGAKRVDAGVEVGNFRRTLSLQSLGQEQL